MNTITFAQPDFLLDHNARWVDSVFNSLTENEKIAQLLMPRANFSGKGYDRSRLKKWVEDYKIGGLVFFAGKPIEQAILTNELQAISKTPMLIGADFEWGLGMRLDSADRYPFQMTLGAMQSGTELIQSMGAEIGRQCNALGVHINYAPVVDVNNNPKNPVINFRAFGEDKENVTTKSLAYMKGLQSRRVISTAKHFPGHGDTEVDSHFDLPVIRHSKNRLDDVELYPFKKLISNGLTGIMTAHIHIPTLDPTPNTAATLSSGIITDLLKNELGFEGLVFTDAMDMKGVVKHFPNGEAIILSLLAGNDIVETFDDVPGAIKAIQDAVKSGRLSMLQIDEKVRKILKAKSWAGLDKYKPSDITSLSPNINSITSDVLNRQMAEKAVTIIKNDNDIIPLKSLNQGIAVVSVGANSETQFQHMIRQYTEADFFVLPPDYTDTLVSEVCQALQQYDIQIIALHLPNNRASAGYSVNAANSKAIQILSECSQEALFVLFGNAFALDKLSFLQKSKTLMLCYQDSDYMQEAAAMGIFGAVPVTGKLPVTVNAELTSGIGIETKTLGRLAYGVPEMEGIDRTLLYFKVDSVINSGLEVYAYPGAVVQINIDGRVIMQKAYGYPDYTHSEANSSVHRRSTAFDLSNAMDAEIISETNFDNQDPSGKARDNKLKVDAIFDLASLTKILASAPAFMQWTDAGFINPDKTLSEVIPELRESNKSDLSFRDMQTHRSGLKAWIPFWKLAVDTLAAYQKVLDTNPQLSENMVYNIKKPGFLKRLFGKKEERHLDIRTSLTRNPSLWDKIVNANTIQWHDHTFSGDPSDEFSEQLSDRLWMNPDFTHTIFQSIQFSEIKSGHEYVYSDLHFYYYPIICKKLIRVSFDNYLHQLYSNIGAYTMGYNPLKRFHLSRIVPTEYDSLFRKSQIHGRVHDEGAALLNGVSGHAGLFGSVNDVSKIMQLYLQKGYYGGQQYINSATIEQFTSYQFKEEGNRRGLIFDKPALDGKTRNAPQKAGELSFGHSGYTGTYTWADPEYRFSYVLLTNRVFPTRNNNKISEMHIRTGIGDILYELLKK